MTRAVEALGVAVSEWVALRTLVEADAATHGSCPRQGLSAAGVGSYFADFRAGQTIYYAALLQAAIRRAQRDEIRYPEFLRQSYAAGCVGYFVWIDGRHVSYMGAKGELHVERFPDAN